MVSGVYSDDNNTQLEATTQFRKLLSIGTGLLIFQFFVPSLKVTCTDIW
jgi:hypothetical protein